MIFNVTIGHQDDPKSWVEKHDFDVTDLIAARSEAVDMVARYNDRLAAGEFARRFIAIEIAPPDCEWHGPMSEPIPEGDTVGCQGCGCLLETRVCEKCGKEFLDFSAKGSGDDIIRRPYVTTSGDLYCCRCGRVRDEAEEQMEGEESWKGEAP